MYGCIVTQRFWGCYTTCKLVLFIIKAPVTLSALLNYPKILFIIKSLCNFVPLNKLQMQYIIIPFLPQKQVSVLKQIRYNLLLQSLVQSDVIRTSSTLLPKVCHSDWHLCSKHNLASSFTMPNRIEIGPNPRMVATLEKNMGQSKMQMKPNKKKSRCRAFPESNTTNTYKNTVIPQGLKRTTFSQSPKLTVLSSQAIFCPRVASWFLIDQ